MNIRDEVQEILRAVLTESETDANAKAVEGVVYIYAINATRLEAYRDRVKELIEEMDQRFKKDYGGGWSFLNLPVDKHGKQWGEQMDAEQLFVLAKALDLADFVLPREMWPSMPGAVPYVWFR